LLRPGGTIALEDVDTVSWLCHPTHPSWDILLNAFHTVFHAAGGDRFIGRKLPVLLRAAGVENIQVKVTVETPPISDERRTHLISLIDSVGEKIIAKGLLPEGALKKHKEVLVRHLSDPRTTIIDQLLVQCWGEKSKWAKTDTRTSQDDSSTISIRGGPVADHDLAANRLNRRSVDPKLLGDLPHALGASGSLESGHNALLEDILDRGGRPRRLPSLRARRRPARTLS
jgi:hypothetical protein